MAGKNVQGHSLEELKRDLRKQGPRPLYVLEGEEALLAGEAVDAIVAASVAAEARDFNLNLYSGDDEAGREFLSQARAYPFLSQRRAVVVRRFEKLSLRERDEAAFLEYLKEPAETTVLVLVASKLDRRTKLAMALERAACLVKVEGLAPAALLGWVRERFAARGLQAADAACRRLIDLAGPGLLDMANEIDKIVARYAAAQGSVGEPEIDATVGQHRAEEFWAINRAFRPNDPGGLLRALSRVLEARVEFVFLGAVLARHVNDLLRLRLLLDRGVTSPGQMAGKLGRPPWTIEQILQQARAFKSEQLLLWLRNLQRADMQMKSSGLPERLVFERALLNSFLGQELP